MAYTVHGILQARTLEWVAVPFSRASSQSRDWTQVSHIAGRFFTSWVTRTAAYIFSFKPVNPHQPTPMRMILIKYRRLTCWHQIWLLTTVLSVSWCYISSQRSHMKQSLVSEGKKKSHEYNSPALSFSSTWSFYPSSTNKLWEDQSVG